MAETRLVVVLNPGIGPGPGDGREMQLIDPASNRIRFYQPAPTQ